MTKAEIMKKLEELTNREFYLDMADRWTQQDWDTHYQISRERANLRAMLKQITN